MKKMIVGLLGGLLAVCFCLSAFATSSTGLSRTVATHIAYQVGTTAKICTTNYSGSWTIVNTSTQNTVYINFKASPNITTTPNGSIPIYPRGMLTMGDLELWDSNQDGIIQVWMMSDGIAGGTPNVWGVVEQY